MQAQPPPQARGPCPPPSPTAAAAPTLPLRTWHGQLGFGHGFDRSLDPLLHCWPMCRPQTLPPALHATCVCRKDRSGQAGGRGQGMAAVSACLPGCTSHAALWWLQLVTPPRQATGQAFKSPLKPAPTAVPAAVPVAAAAPLAAPAPAPAAPPLATMVTNSRGRCRRGCAGAVAGGRWLCERREGCEAAVERDHAGVKGPRRAAQAEGRPQEGQLSTQHHLCIPPCHDATPPMAAASRIARSAAAGTAAGMRAAQRCTVLLALLGLLAPSVDALAWRLFAGRCGVGRRERWFDRREAGHSPQPSQRSRPRSAHPMIALVCSDGRCRTMAVGGVRPLAAGGCDAATPAGVSRFDLASLNPRLFCAAAPMCLQRGVHHGLYARLSGRRAGPAAPCLTMRCHACARPRPITS